MNLDTIQCGFFESIQSKGHNQPILCILKRIQEGFWSQQINDLRSLQGDSYSRAKVKLPAFMVSAASLNGRRKSSDLGEHSGLMQIDIDHLADTAEATSIRQMLGSDPYVLASWVSPSGKGVKAIVPIKADHATHKACFASAKKHFLEFHQLNIDERCSDPGRLCFISHDPGLVLNLSATTIHPSSLSEPASAGGLLADNSSTSAASTSCILHNIIFQKHPGLKALYKNLVVERLKGVSSGLRNAALVEILPVLYSAISAHFIPAFAEEFYFQNRGTFRDSLEQHMREAKALLDGLERDYIKKQLSPQEAEIYQNLNEQQKTVFRICHALASVQNEDCPPPYFFLSAEKLGHRLGVFDMAAFRELKHFRQLGIIQIETVGKRRVKGHRGEATRYQWLPNNRPPEAG